MKIYNRALKIATGEVHQSQIVTTTAVGIVVGMALGMIFRVNYFASWWWLAAVTAVIVAVYLRPKIALMGLAVAAGMVIAFFRVSMELYAEDYVRQFYGQTVVVRGTVAADPEIDEGAIKLKLADLGFGCTEVWECEKIIDGKVYAYVSGGTEVMRSDTVVLEGKLESGFGTYIGQLYRPKVAKVLRPEPGDAVLGVRNWFAERVREVMPEKEAGLGLSYLLGMKTGLDAETEENLRLVGLTHIVVASGAHLAILVEVTKKIVGRLSRLSGVVFAGAFIVFFMAMVGWTPSIMRAGIMTLLTLIVGYSGRKIAPMRLIAIVMATTLMMEPTFLIDLGWQMSFASYAGIMLIGPRLTQFFYGKRKPGMVGSTVLLTVAATVMTLPLTLYYYGMISLVSVVANLLILPTLPIAMGLTFLTGVVAVTPGIEVAAGWLATRVVDFHLFVVAKFAEAQSLLIEIPQGNRWVFLIYGVVAVVLAVGLLRKKVIKLREDKKIGVIMSGHSKWATTKRQKAVVDAKRGALFTKIGNQIAIAARAGTDPNMNPSLAMVLEKARLANMPKANIERAIARVADKSAAALIEEVYEAYGPGGVGIIIEVATDNKNRTMPEVRHTLDKNGGRMADPGSVMFQFARKGVIEITERGETALMAALDAGAEDVVEEDESTIIYTAASDLMSVRQALVDAGLTVTTAEIQYVPTTTVPVEGENAEKLEKLLDAVDELDDVTNTYTNAE